MRGIFDVEAQDPIAVKSVNSPIQTYLVQRTKPRAFRIATRGIEGGNLDRIAASIEGPAKLDHGIITARNPGAAEKPTVESYARPAASQLRHVSGTAKRR